MIDPYARDLRRTYYPYRVRATYATDGMQHIRHDAYLSAVTEALATETGATHQLRMFVPATEIRDEWATLEGGLTPGDGGATYSDSYKWQEADDSGMLDSIAELGVVVPVIARVNGYSGPLPVDTFMLGNGHHRVASAAYHNQLVPVIYSTDTFAASYGVPTESVDGLPTSEDIRDGGYNYSDDEDNYDWRASDPDYTTTTYGSYATRARYRPTHNSDT